LLHVVGSPGWEIQDGEKIVGTDLAEMSVLEVNECKLLCLQQECSRFAFNSIMFRCFLEVDVSVDVEVTTDYDFQLYTLVDWRGKIVLNRLIIIVGAYDINSCNS